MFLEVRRFPSLWEGAPDETASNIQSSGEENVEETNQEVLSPEPYIKHPLQNRWSLWFFKNDKSKTWQANQRLISKFDTVEDFWALYNHIQLSSNLMSGCDYSLFKDGIEPMWEDDRNKQGGRWLVTLSKQQRRSDLDRFWLETVKHLMTTAMRYAEQSSVFEPKETKLPSGHPTMRTRKP
ncbi:eukaryotic translation initiation factor 4eb isoform X4 [Paramormyrops kingsleyae]|uniref:eukaryotic translation initiation factor 4eb isoform X4 n=1 Tax=Paramormyrops kingsleyae TaxID=1676925 RepID=UPI003B9794B8